MRYSLAALIAVVFISLAGCQSSAPARDSASSANGTIDSAAGQRTAVLTVHGMGCPQCANNVDSQLMKVPGVEAVSINMGSGKVLARLSASNPPTRDQLAKAIDQTGFTLVNVEMPKE